MKLTPEVGQTSGVNFKMPVFFYQKLFFATYGFKYNLGCPVIMLLIQIKDKSTNG